MPHEETLKMLNMMDFIRNSNNIKFPGENDLASEEQPVAEAKADEQAVAEAPVATEEPKTENETDSVEDQSKE